MLTLTKEMFPGVQRKREMPDCHRKAKWDPIMNFCSGSKEGGETVCKLKTINKCKQRNLATTSNVVTIS